MSPGDVLPGNIEHAEAGGLVAYIAPTSSISSGAQRLRRQILKGAKPPTCP